MKSDVYSSDEKKTRQSTKQGIKNKFFNTFSEQKKEEYEKLINGVSDLKNKIDTGRIEIFTKNVLNNLNDDTTREFGKQIQQIKKEIINKEISKIQEDIRNEVTNPTLYSDYKTLEKNINLLQKLIPQIIKSDKNDEENMLKTLNQNIAEIIQQKDNTPLTTRLELITAEIQYMTNKIEQKEKKEQFIKSVKLAEQNFGEQFQKINEYDKFFQWEVDDLEFHRNKTTSYKKNILPFINNVSRKAQDVEDAINTLNVLIAKKNDQYSERNIYSNIAKTEQMEEIKGYIKEFQGRITSAKKQLSSLLKQAQKITNDTSFPSLKQECENIKQAIQQKSQQITAQHGNPDQNEEIKKLTSQLTYLEDTLKQRDKIKQQIKDDLKQRLTELNTLLDDFSSFKQNNYDELVKDLNEYDEKEKNNTTQSANKNNTNNSMSQTTNEIRIDTVNRNSRMEMQNLDNITIEKEKNITPNTATLDTRKSNNEMKKDVNINQNITIEKNNHNNTSDDKQPAQYDDKMLTMLLEALKNHQNQNQNELSREVLVKILTDVITKQNSQKQNSVSPKIKVSPKISGGKNTFNNNKNSTERKTKSKKKKNKKKKDANVNQKTSGKISTSSQTTQSAPNSNTPQNSFEEKQGYSQYTYNTPPMPRYYQEQYYAPKNQPQSYTPYLRDRPVYYEEYLPRQTYASQYLPNNAYYYEEYIPEQAFITRNPQQYDIIWPQPPKQQLPDCNYVSYSMTHRNQMSMPQSIYNKNYMPISSNLKDNSKLINKDTFSDVAHNYKK